MITNRKDINKGAYQGELTCPFVVNGVDCASKAIRFVEEVCHNRLRYRCRKCGNTFQYDISNRPANVNPYAAYTGGKGKRMVDRYNEIVASIMGGSSKGVVQ